MALNDSIGLLAAMGDATRLRLLAALEDEELTVAELQDILDLPQSRVSAHLARLREAGLTLDRIDGTRRYYRLADGSMPAPARETWRAVREQFAGDPQVQRDQSRRKQVLASRDKSWLDRVAGSMERHYSPGRTWESLARSLALLPNLGRVADLGAGDGAIAELLLPAAACLVGIESNPVMAAAARRRLSRTESRNAFVIRGDMHDLPLSDSSLDFALLSQSLQYAEQPGAVINEVSRVLVPGGRVLILTLAPHRHQEVRAQYGHVHFGFRTAQLKTWLGGAGLDILQMSPAGRERRSPQFEAIAVLARKPTTNGLGRKPALRESRLTALTGEN